MGTRGSGVRGAWVMAGMLLLVAAAPATAADDGDMQAARDYCVSVGGAPQTREATWNTNSDQGQWVDLGRSMEVCRFQADDEAASRIYVDLLTLHADTPTLASAAWLAKVPMGEDVPAGNPATAYCADLDGSAQFGTGAAGGGWVNLEDPDDIVVGMCVFPDGSAIDEWGLAYHSDGTIRGADLTPLFRADTSAFPPIFGSGVADAHLDTAAAAEAPISASRGGVVEATSPDGTVTTIAFPPGSVPQDMTVVVTPLSQPVTEKGAPLTPGVDVVQKGSEDQHLELAAPAIVTFALRGDVPDDAVIVGLDDAESARVYATSLSRQGETTMVTAFVTSFSPTTVDGEPAEWGDLAPLTPDHRWALSVNGSDSRTVRKVELSLGVDGTLKSTALTGKFAFSGMSGPLDLDLAASIQAGPIAGTLTPTRIKGKASLDDCWVQVANRKKGTFWLRGTGNLFVSGSATLTARASGGGITLSEDFSSQSTSAVKIGVKAAGVPSKVGRSVPATFTIYDGDYVWTYKSKLTWVSR